MCVSTWSEMQAFPKWFLFPTFLMHQGYGLVCAVSVLLQVSLQVQCFSEWHLPAPFVGGGQSQTQTPILKAL